MPDKYTGDFALLKELKMRLTKDLNQFTRIINSEYKTELHKEEDQKTELQSKTDEQILESPTKTISMH